MKLNHINLTVTDVQEASSFLVKYFGMRSMGGNKGMGFLTDDDTGLARKIAPVRIGGRLEPAWPEW